MEKENNGPIHCFMTRHICNINVAYKHDIAH